MHTWAPQAVVPRGLARAQKGSRGLRTGGKGTITHQHGLRITCDDAQVTCDKHNSMQKSNHSFSPKDFALEIIHISKFLNSLMIQN